MNLLQMSFTGAVMILAVTVIRALAINKVPKKTFLVLWGITLVRLMIPFSLPSSISIYSLLGRKTSPLTADTVFPAFTTASFPDTSATAFPFASTLYPACGVLFPSASTV